MKKYLFIVLIAATAIPVLADTGKDFSLPSPDQVVKDSQQKAQQGSAVSVESQPVAEKKGRVILDGQLSSTAKAAFEAALKRSKPLAPGVTFMIVSSEMWGDNPQIKIWLDEKLIYLEYLYHSEANLARLRAPEAWYIPSEPSEDLSKRFEAALMLANEGSAKIRSEAAAKKH